MRCPRCTTGQLTGTDARSRTTTARDIRICTPCGIDEAIRDAAGHSPIPPGEWPISRH
jgi:hypothetical protein